MAAVVTAFQPARPWLITSRALNLVSLDNRSRLLAIIRRTGRFGINILGTHQAALAAAFARPGGGRFDDVIWSPSADLPRLPGSAAWITAEVDEYVTAGDHTVLLAHVHAAEPGEGGREPLTYHQRLFGTHTPLTT